MLRYLHRLTQNPAHPEESLQKEIRNASSQRERQSATLYFLRPFSRVTARVTKSKVHVYQDDPQLLRLLFESENGKPRERVIRELSKGPPLMQ